jgi:hypothetical protein
MRPIARSFGTSPSTRPSVAHVNLTQSRISARGGGPGARPGSRPSPALGGGVAMAGLYLPPRARRAIPGSPGAPAVELDWQQAMFSRILLPAARIHPARTRMCSVVHEGRAGVMPRAARRRPGPRGRR